MPLTLPHLYTLPSDVWDWVSSDFADLAQDDHKLATGQVIRVTTAAAQGALSLSVTALLYPLLSGTQLVFDGGGTTSPVQVTLTATALTGATNLVVAALSASIGQYAQATDSGLNLATGARLLTGCKYGTSQVKLYCSPRYNDSDLFNNAGEKGSVNRWATILASRWLAKRQLRSCPEGLAEDYEEAMGELRRVQLGSLLIEDIPTRTSGWPFVTNSAIDIGYSYAKARIEPMLSEATPVQYGQYVDSNSILFVEY